MTIYAIGDIHGHLEKLKIAHDRIASDRAREGTDASQVIHVGDLVDRGPDSAGVITYLRKVQAEDPRNIILRGNHDQYYIDFLTLPLTALRETGGLRWLDANIGGRETLASYGIRNWLAKPAHRTARIAISEDDVSFMAQLPFSHAIADCFFVHAGIRPGVPLSDQTEEDMLWIRSDFLLSTRDHGPLIVHGHTPADDVMHMGNRLGIDTGAAFGGPLSTVAIEGREVFLLTDQGRVRVR